MTQIETFPPDERREIRFLLTDIDDTITDHGKLPAAAYAALWRLNDAGIHVIPVTGRPAGWCDLICRQWPVAGVVGENGAFVFFQDGGRLQILRHPQAPEPLANREKLEAIAREVYAAVPGTRPAKDQFSRMYDVAIDFREEPPILDLEAARRIQQKFEARGAEAKISSIHVNAWFGSYDKLSMTEHFLSDRFGLHVDEENQNRQVVFCGDSPNDEPMFRAFHNSVGVSNILEYANDLEHLPRYVTRAPSAVGFVEAVDTILNR